MSPVVDEEEISTLLPCKVKSIPQEKNLKKVAPCKMMKKDSSIKRKVLAIVLAPFSGYVAFWTIFSLLMWLDIKVGLELIFPRLILDIIPALAGLVSCALVSFLQAYFVREWGIISGLLIGVIFVLPLVALSLAEDWWAKENEGFLIFVFLIILALVGGAGGGYFGERIGKKPDSDLVPSKVHLWRKGMIAISAILCFSSVAWILFRYLLGYIFMIWGPAGSLINEAYIPPIVECSAISIFVACFVTGFGLGFLLRHWGMLYGFFIGGVSSMLISETHRDALSHFYIGYPWVLIPALFIPALVGGVVGGYFGERIGKRKAQKSKG